MNFFVLYLLLLKATITAFTGPSSLPIIRDELVVNRHVLTDEQLNTSVVVGRITPGPNGLYVVSVGYFVAGMWGAVAGWLAMITPALLVVPAIQFLGHRADHPVAQNILKSVILGSVGLVVSTIGPLARSAITGILPLAVAVGSCAALIFLRLHTVWIILGSAAVTLIAFFVLPA